MGVLIGCVDVWPLSGLQGLLKPRHPLSLGHHDSNFGRQAWTLRGQFGARKYVYTYVAYT
eukprot:7260129-Pyramimonas_sp.AAC.1